MKKLPTDAAYDALLDQARAAVRGRKLAHAEQLVHEALAHHPERAAAYNLLAVLKDMQGEHLEAINILRAGLALDPIDELSLKNLDRMTTYPRKPALLEAGEDDS